MENISNLKSYSVLKQLLDKLNSIDDYQFPNNHAISAKIILINSIKNILSWLSSHNIEERIIIELASDLDYIIFLLANSNINKLNWAIVHYSDDLLKRFFKNHEACIIYSLFVHHKYFILELTKELEEILKNILDKNSIDKSLKIDKYPSVWCLCLSSIDEKNITTYANIAHEIGHIVYKYEQISIVNIMNKILKKNNLDSFYNNADFDRKNKVGTVLFSLLEEMTADVVGAILLGPAFLLSLNEFIRDVSDRYSDGKWVIEEKKSNYPSINFRKKCIQELVEYSKILHDIKNISAINNLDQIVDKYIDNININNDEFSIRYDEDLASYLNKNMSIISDILLEFSKNVYSDLLEKYKITLQNYNFNNVDNLIKRIITNVPPNIINNNTFLGELANYSEILLSAYLYKIYICHSNKYNKIHKEKIDIINNINNLTTKAIECTYIQREYDKKFSKTRTKMLSIIQDTKEYQLKGGVLNSDEIKALIWKRELLITPLLSPDQISGSGVDVRLGTSIIFPKRAYIGSIDITDKNIIYDKCRFFEKMHLKYHTPFTLHPNQLILGATFEYLSLPNYLHAQILSRSSYGRLGLIVATAVTIHPEYQGVLTLELCNLSDSPITLYPGMPVAQLVFYGLSGGPLKSKKKGSYLFSTEAKLPEFLDIKSNQRNELHFWGKNKSR